MQICDAEVRLAGNVYHVVPKQGLTPAEIYVLREIHGSDAVVNIRPVKEDDKRGIAEEFGRLKRLYDGASINAPDEDGPRKISLERLFPGAMKKLPKRLSDLGISATGDPAEAPDAVEAA
jgi:hypothetical protein